jgi:putative transcriptional regulator
VNRKKLVELRGEVSRQQIAEELGITPQMLGAIERGNRTPSLPLAQKIASYYNVSIEFIFFNENRNKSFPFINPNKEVI